MGGSGTPRELRRGPAHLLVLGLDELRELLDAQEVLGPRLARAVLVLPLLRPLLRVPQLRLEGGARLCVALSKPAPRRGGAGE